MRVIQSFLIFGLLLSAVGAPASAQTPPPAPPPPPPRQAPAKKPPSRLRSMVGKLADSAATTAAGMAADSLLGTKGKSVANALGVGNQPCAQGALPGLGGVPTVSAGIAVVGAAKKTLLKKKTDSTAAPASAPVPCLSAAQLSGMAAGVVPGVPQGANPSIPGLPGGMTPMGAAAMMTPIGMAVAAAPLAGAAAKGIKGMLGGKPQDKIAMLRELGKGRLVLKDVKFIQGTAELEAGFEASFAQLGEAIALAEGTYILHVPAEAGEKGEAPDTALARKRIEKVWAAILVNGVSDQRIIAVGVLSPEMNAGRKPPKKGDARIEFIRLPKQP